MLSLGKSLTYIGSIKPPEIFNCVQLVHKP
jgi:hypothetical protein